MAVVWQIGGDRRISEKMCNYLVDFFAIRKFTCSDKLLLALKTAKHLPDIVLDLGYREGCEIGLQETLKNSQIPVLGLDLVSGGSKFYSSIIGKLLDQISKNSESLSPRMFRETRFVFKDLSLDLETRQLCFDSQPELSVHLPTKEAKILALLVASQGKPVQRELISKRLWPTTTVSPSSLNSHISRLRNRIRGSEAAIESVYGGGYILK